MNCKSKWKTSFVFQNLSCREFFETRNLHAIVLERVRFAPVGWTKVYEFSDSDLACAITIMDNFLDAIPGITQLDYVNPEKIPFGAMRNMFHTVVYGGRIENPFDSQLLQTIIDHLFDEEVFQSNYSVNKTHVDSERLLAPEGKIRDDFVSWIRQLPIKGSPTWVDRENFVSYRVSKQELVTSRRDWYEAVKHTKHSAVPVSGSSPFVHARFYLKRDEFEEIHPFTEQSPIFTFRMGTAEVPRILEDCLKTMRRHDYARFDFSAVAFYCIKEMLDLRNSSVFLDELLGC